MYKVELLPKAITDIINVVDYISKDNVFYANKVQEYINKSIMLLWDFPFIWIKLNDTYRQIVEPHYKFKIVYRVLNDTIYIVSIFREQNSWNI